MTTQYLTQRDAVLAILRERMSIGLTQLEALHEAGIGRLASRVDELRNMGYKIVTTWEIKGRKRWARYVLKAR